ncbi:hypothetical protein LXL04_005902 [Taraxacum kok-saghyz]
MGFSHAWQLFQCPNQNREKREAKNSPEKKTQVCWSPAGRKTAGKRKSCCCQFKGRRSRSCSLLLLLVEDEGAKEGRQRLAGEGLTVAGKMKLLRCTENPTRRRSPGYLHSLKQVTFLDGKPSRMQTGNFLRHEAQGIKQIVDEISQRLVTSRANEDLIGMRTRVQGLKSELQIEAGGVRMIGVWGVGGGGKSTLASYIYDDISNMFDSCCFVNNIREESLSHKGLEKLQENILSGILKKQVQEVRRVEEGRRMIMARLGHKKVLIVLDDVDQVDQLRALVGSRDWFGEGSRIIITTRDEHLLKAHGVDVIHPTSLLNNYEAFRLFCKYAHRDRTPTEDFEKFSKEVVSYADGLPLALKVLGSFLCGRNTMQWRSAIDKLKDIPNKDIIRILRISFDGLEEDEKDLFLDIACFFRGTEKSEAMKMLDACGYHPVIGVEVLREKALIVITKDGDFDMHDLVQEMGHYIVREKHPRNPEQHNRVWKWKDVRRILDMDATMVMVNLAFHYLPNLTHMELGELPNLIKISDFSGLRKLIKTFKLDYCLSLEEIHPSLGRLERLVLLSIKRCPRLRKFPSITRIKKLETLEFEYCQKLEIISEDNIVKEVSSRNKPLPNLDELKISDDPSISRLDFSILRLPRLKWLNVSKCKGLVELSELPTSIVVVIADYCDSLESFGDISNLKLLWRVSLLGKNKLHQRRRDTLICSMFQRNASEDEDHCISVALQHQLPNGLIGRLFRGNTFRLHLPDDWYNDFCGFLICIVTNINILCFKISMKQEGPPFDLSHESHEAMEPIYHGKTTCIGYASFSSLKHTKLLTSSYNIILVTVKSMFIESFDDKTTYCGIELIPRKSKIDKVQTTNCSEFWDKKLQDARFNAFTIQQYDLDSSVEISWKPLL